jgi:uncharacterized membrane protein HdeD (DUF308 family)
VNIVTRPKSPTTRVVLPSILIVLGVLVIAEGVISGPWFAVIVGVAVVAYGIAGLLRFRHQRLLRSKPEKPSA